MLYFVVMGSLALSVLFSAGWLLHRVGRWMLGGRAVRRGTKPAAASPRKRAAAKAKPAAQGRRTKAPREPGQLMRFLARLGSSVWPLTLLSLLLFGGFKLAERGMEASPRTPPAGFYDLVTSLGWLALGLVTLSLLVAAARWRCRGDDSR